MRLRRRRLVIYLSVTAVLFVIVYFSLHRSLLSQRSNRFKYSDQESLGIGLPLRETLKPLKPIPLLVPQIHVKKLPAIVVSENQTEVETETNFFKYLENKDIRCNNDQRLGHQHDGGWNVCMSPPMGLKKPCLIYSFGIGNDWNFDDAVSQIYGCSVLSFDPSIQEHDHNRSSLIRFKRIGLGPTNQESPAGWKLKTLGTHFRNEGHENSIIDYVKFDIEYSEWEVLESIFREGSLKNVKQIGFEMHSRELFKVSKINMPTGKREFVKMYKTLRKLEQKNFRKFNYRLNPLGQYKSIHTKKTRSCCYELHYINMNFVKPNEMINHYEDSKLFH